MENQIPQAKFLSWRLLKRIILILVIILVFDLIFFSTPAMASEAEDNIAIDGLGLNTAPAAVFFNGFPENNALAIKNTGYYHITAYTSEASQCDGAPCLTANGFNLCEYGIEDSIAANFLPFGAKVKIPELFGDKVFVVRDRMNERYNNRLDIWFIDKSEAINFGVKMAKVEILE